MQKISYLVPKNSLTLTQEIKKSRFITYVAHTASTADSDEFLQSIKQQYPDARHHCWARITGAPNDSMSYGFSDDGEPSGTAGKPMLQQLTGSDIGEITVVVVRYFGGIKLGTGGLVRAYGSSVHMAVNQLETTLKVAKENVSIEVPFELTGTFEHLVKQFDATILNREFAVSLMCNVEVPSTKLNSFKQALNDQGKGKIQIKPETDS
jgi:uncharacterized YigZ family protein